MSTLQTNWRDGMIYVTLAIDAILFLVWLGGSVALSTVPNKP